jgi:SAM-dependent methyltransferase
MFQRAVIPLLEVRKIDSYLRSKWGIILTPDSPEAWEETIIRKVGLDNYVKLAEINEIRRNATDFDNQLERSFYQLIANKPFGSWFHSQRRPLILDGTALVQGICNDLGTGANILEVGCGLGYSAGWIAKNQNHNILAIDSSEETLETPRDKFAHLRNISFRHHDILTGDLTQEFDLIYSIDGLPAHGAHPIECFSWLARHLKPNGLIVVAGIHAEILVNAEVRTAIQPILDSFELGLVHIEPIGGWGGGIDGWLSDMALIFKQGIKSQLPENMREQMDSIWKKFAHYANTPNRPKDHKTVAHYLGSHE